MSRKKRVRSKGQNLVIYKRILLIIILIFLFRENLIYNPVLNFLLTNRIEATIIKNKNYLRRGQFTGAFVYSYKFEINGKYYENSSNNEKFIVGEKLIVEYNPKFPFINRIYKSRFSN